MYEDDVGRQFPVWAAEAGVGRSIGDRVNHATVRSCRKLYLTCVRQVGRAGSGDWLLFHDLETAADGDPQHAPRGARTAHDQGNRGA